jgi:hypothetical protein
MGVYRTLCAVDFALVKRAESDQQVADALCNVSLLNQMFPAAPSPSTCDLGKLWDGLLFLIDASRRQGLGVAAPGQPNLGRAILGAGQYIDVSAATATAAYLDPESVGEVAAALRAIPMDGLRNLVDPEQMEAMNVYPCGYWEDEDPDDLADELLECAHALTAFYSSAAAANLAVVIHQYQ